MFDKYYGYSAPLMPMVKDCFIEFRCDCSSTSDVEHSDRPVEVTAPGTTEKIDDMRLAYRRLKLHEILP